MKKYATILFVLFTIAILISCATPARKYCYRNDCCGQCIQFVDQEQVQWINFTDYSGFDTLVGNFEKSGPNGFLYALKPKHCKSYLETFPLKSVAGKDSVTLNLEFLSLDPETSVYAINLQFLNKNGLLIKKDGAMSAHKTMNPYQINLHKKAFPITVSVSTSEHWKAYQTIQNAASQRMVFHLEEAFYSFGQSDTLRFKMEKDTLQMLELNGATNLLFAEKLVAVRKK